MKSILQLRRELVEKTLTPAELKKREEIAQAMERDNPGMDKSKKMAIATAQAKKVAEEVELDEEMPTGVKTFHKNKDTGKEHATINFTAKAAAEHESDLKKAGHTITGRALMFGAKEGPRRNVNEEVDLDESSKVETGQLFKHHLDKAIAASEAGDHTRAKRHLADAQTARYGILAKHVPKHQASFDKYKELKHSYTNSDEPVREETDLDEAHKINDKVEIIKGSSKGIAGHIGEIRHGAFKGAPKEYTVYHGEHGATRVSKEHIRKLKEESLDEISKDTLTSYAHKAFAQGNDLHYELGHSKGDKATDAERQAIKDKISKRNTGVIKAAQKMAKEDVDQIDEVSKKTLHSYINKASFDVASNAHGVAQAGSNIAKIQKPLNKLNKRLVGIDKAAGKMAKEEVEQIDEASIKLFMGKYQVWHKGQKVASYNSKTDAQDHANSLKEGVEELDELSKNTLKSYIGKAVQSHGSNRVIANMAWDKSEKQDDLLDKVGHKSLKDAKKRATGITKAVNKLTTEGMEEFAKAQAKRRAEARKNKEKTGAGSKLTKEEYVAKSVDEASINNKTNKNNDEPPFTPDAPKSNVAKAGKFGYGYSAARHLARQAMQDVMKKNKE